MIKKRYIFLILIVCLFAVSAVSGAEIANDTNMGVNDYDSSLIAESMDENLLSDSYGTFQELQDEIDAVEEGGTLNLTRNYKYVNGSTGGVDIYRTITINGNGFYLDGCNQSRIFHVGGSNVVLNNLTLINGYAENAGGIAWHGNNGTIKFSLFLNNIALEDGAAIYTSDCNLLSIQNCNFTNNEANAGGGIYCHDTNLKIFNSTFIKNIGWDCGGAIHCRCPNSLIDNCTFIKNEGNIAGAVYFDRPNCVVNNSFFIENKAYRYGGAFWWTGIQGTLNNSIFINNVASESEKAISWTGAKGKLENLIYYYKDTITIRANTTMENCTKIYNTAPYCLYIVENNNLTKYYNESTNFTVRILKAEGGYVGAGEKINFIINNNNNYSFTDNDGYASIDEKIQPGNYSIKTSYNGCEVINEVNILPTLLNKDMKVFSNDIREGKIEYIQIVLPEDATGSVSALINNVVYSVNIVGGMGTIEIPNLKAGEYSVEVIYSGDSQYNSVKNITLFNVEKTIINAPNVTKYYGGYEQFVVKITDNNGNPLVNRNISIVINETTYIKVTNKEGIVSMNINLNPGEYDVVVICNDTKVNSKITILSTVYAEDVVKIFRNDTQYYVTFLDSNGGYLPYQTEIMFNISDVYYWRLIQYDGRTKFNVNLYPGDWIISTTNPFTGEYHVNSITVLPNIAENNNLTKYYNEPEQFSVMLLGPTGEPISGKQVTFLVDHWYHIAYSDSNGYAFLDADLQPNTYEIITNYNNYEVKNTITILPTLLDKDMEISSSDIYVGENEIIKVVLPDNATGKVSTIIDNNEYSANVENGNANIIIPDLKPGNYDIEVIYSGNSYYNSVKGNVSFIVDNNLVLSAQNVTKYFGGSEMFIVTFTDYKGNPLVNKTIYLDIDGKTYPGITDSNGVASINFTLAPNVYDIVVRYEDINITSKITVLSTIYTNDVDGIYGNTTFEATFLDTLGNPLSNREVQFKVDTNNYSAITNDNGIVSVNINLNAGLYNITSINPINDEEITNKLVISKASPTIILSESQIKNIVTLMVAVSSSNTDGETILLKDATGYIFVDVEGNGYYTPINDGKATVNIVCLESGNYTANIFYTGDENYDATNTTKNIEIPEIIFKDANLKVSVENTTINVTINKNATGLIIVTVDDISFVYDVSETPVVLNVANLDAGTYDVLVTYIGDDIFAAANATGKVTVPSDKNDTPIDPKADIRISKDSVNVILPSDAKGYVLVDIDYDIYYVPVQKGKASFEMPELAPGNYTVDVYYSGDDKYAPANATGKIEIPKIEPLDSELEVNVVNTTVIVTIDEGATGVVLVDVDGTTYYAEIKDGQAIIDVKGLEAGENYTATVIYTGDDNFTEDETTVKISVPKEEEIEPEDASMTVDSTNSTITVELPEDATGYVLVDIDGKGYYAKVTDGKASVDVAGLDAGNYTATVTYTGDDNYKANTSSVAVSIPEEDEPIPEPVTPEMTVKVTNTTIEVTLPKDATGNVLVDVDGQGYYALVKDGKATVNVIGLDEGNYSATVTYAGDDKYTNASKPASVTVPEDEEPTPEPVDPKADINVSDDAVNVELPKDATGYMLVDVDGKGYYAPVKDGKASIDLPELAPGNHTVTVTYTGDDKYKPATANKTVTVEKEIITVVSENLTKIEKAPDRFEAVFTDSDGNALANKDVTFGLNDITYTRTTDANGKAGMNINLVPGTYSIKTTNPVTNESVTNTITVLPRFTEDSDLVKYFRNDSQYVLKVLDDNGNPAKAGEIVTYNINGVFYNRTTNATGHVKLSINLPPKTYIITAEYKGCKVAHNVTVLPTLTGNDLTKKYGQSGAYEAKLVDGQGKAYANQKIEFNINGVMYQRTTDANGVAKLNINLMPGEYIITSMYSNGATTSNKVTIRS